MDSVVFKDAEGNVFSVFAALRPCVLFLIQRKGAKGGVKRWLHIQLALMQKKVTTRCMLIGRPIAILYFLAKNNRRLRRGRLPAPPHLRTVRETFTSYRSSIS